MGDIWEMYGRYMGDIRGDLREIYDEDGGLEPPAPGRYDARADAGHEEQHVPGSGSGSGLGSG